jgi:hypothetical protein
MFVSVSTSRQRRAARGGDAAVKTGLIKPLRSRMVATEKDIAWLAGIIDGEGCFSVKRAIRRRTGRRAGSWTSYQLWIVLCNTSEPMIRRSERILRDMGVHFQPVRRVWKGKKATRWQYWLHVARKADVLSLTEQLLPHLTAKALEARAFAWFLRKACRVKQYYATVLDKAVLDALSLVKRNGGEAPAEAEELFREVIPSQAVEGPDAVSGGSAEGVESRGPSPNGNDPHERPAAHLHVVSG